MFLGLLTCWTSVLVFASSANCRIVDVNWCSVCLVRAEIQTGDVVRWTNLDKETHSLVSIGKEFEFTIKAKERVKKVFNNAGKYAFYCKNKPWMKGVIVVQESLADLRLRSTFPECERNGKYYQSGSRLRVKCQKCSCTNGGWSCADLPKCKKRKRTTINKTRPKVCIHSGKYYENGSRVRVKCSKCLCTNGEWSCAVRPDCKTRRKSIVKKTRSKDCHKCRRRHRISSRTLCKRKFDLVIRFRMVSIRRINPNEDNQEFILVVNNTHVFHSPRNNALYSGLHQLHLSPVSFYCNCPRLEYNGDYVMMSRQGKNQTIVVTPDSIVTHWSENWRRKIRHYLRKMTKKKCGKYLTSAKADS